jgi:maltose-binding protein MalE
MELNPSLTTIQQDDPKVYNQIGFLPMPPGPLNHTGKGVAYAAANGFYISADSKHPHDAWLLMEQYLKDSSQISKVLDASPVLKADQHASWIESNPELKAMYQTMGQMRLQGNPNIPQWVTSVRGTIYTDAQAILYGHSVASVLGTMNAAIQNDLSTTK